MEALACASNVRMEKKAAPESLADLMMDDSVKSRVVAAMTFVTAILDYQRATALMLAGISARNDLSNQSDIAAAQRSVDDVRRWLEEQQTALFLALAQITPKQEQDKEQITIH